MSDGWLMNAHWRSDCVVNIDHGMKSLRCNQLQDRMDEETAEQENEIFGHCMPTTSECILLIMSSSDTALVGVLLIGTTPQRGCA